jgi:hypothetical protein
MGAVPGFTIKMSAPNGKLWNKELDPVDPERR